MPNVELEAQPREELGRKSKKARQQGFIPAVVYGRKIKPLAISVNYKDFIKKILRSEAELNLIFNLKVGGKDIPVITCAMQKDSITDQILHLDFKNIIMDEAIKTKVPVELVGIPIGVKDSGGVLVHGLRDIEIKCLPGDIPDKFEIDVSAIDIGHSLHVSDLKISDKIQILSSPNEMIATVSAPTKEEEVAPPPSPLEAVPAEGVAGAAPAEGAPAGAAPAAGTPAATAAKPGAPAAKSEKGAAGPKK
jgi:large subunit ribosomal protein L25